MGIDGRARGGSSCFRDGRHTLRHGAPVPIRPVYRAPPLCTTSPPTLSCAPVVGAATGYPGRQLHPRMPVHERRHRRAPRQRPSGAVQFYGLNSSSLTTKGRLAAVSHRHRGGDSASAVGTRSGAPPPHFPAPRRRRHWYLENRLVASRYAYPLL